MSKNIKQVTEWILKYHPEIKEISEETDLIESRLVDSLRFMELVFFLENLCDIQIDPSKLQIDDFRTLKNIEKTFLNQKNMPSFEQSSCAI